MSEPCAIYDDATPCHFEPAPLGELAAKSHALQQSYRTIEELQQQVEALKRENAQVRALLDKSLVGVKEVDDA